MTSWAVPAVPRLPGLGRPVRVFDTATGSLQPTAPGPTARMYVCGITPYDATHMGHAATYVAFDTLLRVWRDGGHEVRYVQNVTDVDDPLLVRANETGVDWRDLARREIELFYDDMAALRVIPPAEYIGAVEAIPRIIDYVQLLRDRGAVYELEGDLYFSVSSDFRFGGLCRLDETEMVERFAENGGDPQRVGKKHPLDALVWRLERPGEPSWPAPFGAGRPGWHIECSAIAVDHLGMSFDIQGGGRDLVFPHHEMSASHAQVATGKWPFARHYVHAGLVGLDGEKMSKSKGNLVFVSKLRMAGVDPGAMRLAVLAHHYRTDWEWTGGVLIAAEERLVIWRAAVGRERGASVPLGEIRAVLADDLATPRALRLVDRWANDTLHGSQTDDEAAPALMRDVVDALLGVDL